MPATAAAAGEHNDQPEQQQNKKSASATLLWRTQQNHGEDQPGAGYPLRQEIRVRARTQRNGGRLGGHLNSHGSLVRGPSASDRGLREHARSFAGKLGAREGDGALEAAGDGDRNRSTARHARSRDQYLRPRRNRGRKSRSDDDALRRRRAARSKAEVAAVTGSDVVGAGVEGHAVRVGGVALAVEGKRTAARDGAETVCECDCSGRNALPGSTQHVSSKVDETTERHVVQRKGIAVLIVGEKGFGGGAVLG